jgi:hypothetical protein
MVYIVVICNLRQLQDENTKVNFVLKIIKQIHAGSETI